MIFEQPGLQMHYEVQEGILPENTLFIHGNLASNRWWQPAIEIWRKQAAQLSNGSSLKGQAILAEWRGCGKSSPPASEGEMNPEVLAQDYVAFIRHLNRGPVAVVAHSTGGLIAMIAMLQAPELFTRAFFLDTVSATGIQFEPAMYEAFTQMSQNREICAAVMGATIHGHGESTPFFEGLVDDAFGVGQHVWHGIPRHLHNVDIRSRLSEIRIPITVAHGQFDTLLPVDRSQYLAAHLPQGQFLEIEEQGHSTNVENPEKFVRIVNQYLFERS